MTWLLDTNIMIHLSDGEHSTIDRLEGLRGEFAISAVTRVEPEGGVYRIPYHPSARRREQILC